MLGAKVVWRMGQSRRSCAQAKLRKATDGNGSTAEMLPVTYHLNVKLLLSTVVEETGLAAAFTDVCSKSTFVRS
ncbi:hypothetical protein Pmani_032013 [Petrolisthes manimaculis]|uniref:Uncharacterized protein n=1 Tax=Petrolisthes manimaculis TaxID=1843537 RepID=A0AAE1NU69_9EUCA|nr:hypothetical protein Pmani_032013 [Petrolisthes manimaculis]